MHIGDRKGSHASHKADGQGDLFSTKYKELYSQIKQPEFIPPPPARKYQPKFAAPPSRNTGLVLPAQWTLPSSPPLDPTGLTGDQDAPYLHQPVEQGVSYPYQPTAEPMAQSYPPTEYPPLSEATPIPEWADGIVPEQDNLPLPEPKTPVPSKKRSLVVIGNVAFYLLLILLLLSALSFTTNSNTNKSFFGYRWYWISTGSMEPELPIGCLAIVKVIPPEQLRLGDDVTFVTQTSGGDKYVTHRIVEIHEPKDAEEKLEFVTKGIANPNTDPDPRPANTAVGKVVYHLAYVGIAMAVLRSSLLVIAAMIACLVGVLFLLRKKKHA